MQAPRQIAGASVIEWVSSDAPFGEVPSPTGGRPEPIYCLAICRYEGSSSYCRFDCDKDWQPKQDRDFHSIDEAKADVSFRYRRAHVAWRSTVR
jgi:hypothetical protein